MRVYPQATVGTLRPGRWADVDDGDPRLAGWLAMGLVATVGPYGEAAPTVLAPLPCCGRI